MKKYILIHLHCYGVTTYLFETESDIEENDLDEDTVEKLIKEFNLDYDEDEDTICIDELPISSKILTL